MIQVLRTRSLPCPTCLPQYPHGCTHVLTWWDALPVCLVHNSATVYLPYWPTCYCWPWPSRPVCLPECSKPWLPRLPTESPTICWKLYLFSMMPDACGSLPLSSVQHTMDHTLSKWLVVDNIDMPATTYMNVIQMLSSLTSMSPQV